MRRLSLIGAAVLGAASPAWAQRLGQGEDVAVSITRVIAALLLIAGLAAAALYFGRKRIAPLKFWSPATDRRLKVIETVRLTPGASLCLASVDGREFILALTPGGATVIDPAGGTA